MIKIFLSSTFQEMAFEREMIATKVVPEVRKFAKGCNEYLDVCDLRWGIETKDIIKVIKCCLKKINNNTDSVIAIIGSQAGTTVPLTDELRELLENFNQIKLSQDHFSITQLELEYGILSSNTPVGRCYYTKEATIGENKDLLARLQKKLGNENCVCFDNIDTLVEDLKGYIKSLIIEKSKLNRTNNWIEEELLASDSLVKDILREAVVTIGGREQLRQILRENIDDEASRIVCLYGGSGLGKSTILADIYETYKKQEKQGIDDYFIACGYGKKSKTYLNLLQQLIYLFSLHIENPPNTDPWDVFTVGAAERKLEQLIAECNDTPTSGTMRIFIDGLDKLQLHDFQETSLCEILLRSTKIKAVVSCIDELNYNKIHNDYGGIVKQHKINSLTETDIRQILRASMEYAEDEFDKNIVDVIKKKAGAISPLYLVGAIAILKINIFDAQKQKKGRLFKYYKKLIHDMPDSVEEMCQYVLLSVGEYLKWNEWERVVQLISASSNGISDSDLAALFAYHGWNWQDAHFYSCVWYLDHFFHYLPDGRLCFSHDIIKTAVRSFYQYRLRKIRNECLFSYLKASIAVDPLHIEDGLLICNNECQDDYALELFKIVEATTAESTENHNKLFSMMVNTMQKFLGDHEWLVSHIAATKPESLLHILYGGVRMFSKEDFERRAPALEVCNVFLQNHLALKTKNIGNPMEDSRNLQKYINQKCDNIKELYALFLSEYIGTCESMSVGETGFVYEGITLDILSRNTFERIKINDVFRCINCVFYSNNKLLKKTVDKKIQKAHRKYITKKNSKSISTKAIQWFNEHESQINDVLTKGKFINNEAQYYNALREFNNCWQFRKKALDIKCENLHRLCLRIYKNISTAIKAPDNNQASDHWDFWKKWLLSNWQHIENNEYIHSELFDIAISYRAIATDIYYLADMKNVETIKILQNGVKFLELSIYIQDFIRDGRERELAVTRIRLLGMEAKLYKKLLENNLLPTSAECQDVEKSLRELACKTKNDILRYLKYDSEEKKNFNRNIAVCVDIGLNIEIFL